MIYEEQNLKNKDLLSEEEYQLFNEQFMDELNEVHSDPEVIAFLKNEENNDFNLSQTTEE